MGFLETLIGPVSCWGELPYVGIRNLSVKPQMLMCPSCRFSYFLRGSTAAWRSLGGVLLCVTGCEALFAGKDLISPQEAELVNIDSKNE